MRGPDIFGVWVTLLIKPQVAQLLFFQTHFQHFLLFRYEGDSHFHVLVFDMTASEIEYPYATDPTIDHAHHQVSLEILDDFPPSQTTNHVDMIDITSSEEEFHPNEASSLLKSEEIESDFPPTQKTSKTRGKNSSLKPHNACSSHTYHSSIPDCRGENFLLEFLLSLIDGAVVMSSIHCRWSSAKS